VPTVPEEPARGGRRCRVPMTTVPGTAMRWKVARRTTACATAPQPARGKRPTPRPRTWGSAASSGLGDRREVPFPWNFSQAKQQLSICDACPVRERRPKPPWARGGGRDCPWKCDGMRLVLLERRVCSRGRGPQEAKKVCGMAVAQKRPPIIWPTTTPRRNAVREGALAGRLAAHSRSGNLVAGYILAACARRVFAGKTYYEAMVMRRGVGAL
jgi:hypothetical protein